MKKLFKKIEEQILIAVSFLFFLALVIVGLWTARELAVSISSAIVLEPGSDSAPVFDLRGFEELRLP